MPQAFQILLVAATPPEIEATVHWVRARALSERENTLVFRSAEVEILFTGVGPAAAGYVLGHRFGTAAAPDLAIQAGVGGAINPDLSLGEVVQVISERFGDLGAEEKDGSWLSLGDIGLHPGLPFSADEILCLPPFAQATPFRQVAGITLSQTTGTLAKRDRLLARWQDAEVETMEGAPFFRACLDAGISPVQLRAISNYVEARNRPAWKLGEAIAELNGSLQQLLGGFLG